MCVEDTQKEIIVNRFASIVLIEQRKEQKNPKIKRGKEF